MGGRFLLGVRDFLPRFAIPDSHHLLSQFGRSSKCRFLAEDLFHFTQLLLTPQAVLDRKAGYVMLRKLFL
jgi:hypothetical protein